MKSREKFIKFLALVPPMCDLLPKSQIIEGRISQTLVKDLCRK